MIDPVLGLFLPPAIGLFGALCCLPHWLSERRLAKTPEGRQQVAYDRLVEHYRYAGHENPSQAAMDHVSTLTDVERFRRDACEAYAAKVTALDDIKSDWWKDNGRMIQDCMTVTREKTEAMQYGKILRETIFSASEDEIFVHEPAASKWKEEKAKRDAAVEAAIRAHTKPDPVRAYVLEGLFKAGY